MPRTIDWLYHRNACVTCKKAADYREACGAKVREVIDARQVRYDGTAALKLLDDVNQLVVAKGKKVLKYDLKKARPNDDELLAALLGPTGNLRAPTARMGKTLIVGFNEELYQEMLA
jgi:arsenate reductase-like glutaredoxin family protein